MSHGVGGKPVNGSGKRVSHRKLGAALAAGLSNEQTTRSRVDYLERCHDATVRLGALHQDALTALEQTTTEQAARIEAHSVCLNRPFWGRMRWLFAGR